MNRCPSCGGVIGRDCFNPQECAQITYNLQHQSNIQPYIDALLKAKEVIQWYEDEMPYDESVQCDRFHNYAYAISLIDSLVPKPDLKSNDNDDLPF